MGGCAVNFSLTRGTSAQADNPEPSQSGTQRLEGVTTIPQGSRARARPKRESRFRICRRCHTGKPLTDEHFYLSDNRGTPSECRACWRKTVWERTHGVPWAFYMSLLESQGRQCAICAISLDEYRRTYTRYQEFHLDHSHTTGAKRGLLCHNCNRALGMLQDSVAVVERAAQYLKRQEIV